jgi:fructose-1,6-bisphosphatase/inositol monophosphatase family enzyme
MLANWHAPKRVNSAYAHDIKLELDVRCQKLIEKILRAAFPQISAARRGGRSGNANSEYRWVVDPIDGTVNYAHGLPHAAVSIALQKRDECRVTSDGNSKTDGERSSTSPSRVTCHPPWRDLRSVHGRTLDARAAGRRG